MELPPEHIELLAVNVMDAVRQAIPSAGSNVEGLAAFMSYIDSKLGRGAAKVVSQ